MRELTYSEIERLQREGAEASVPFAMDEDAFRIFYDRTARPLWAYLSRLTGDRTLADDLLQETYYRFLRAAFVMESEAHGRNYLFRIATNLARDTHRRRTARPELQLESLPGWDAGWPEGQPYTKIRPHGWGADLQVSQRGSAGDGEPGRGGADLQVGQNLRQAWVRLKPRERALLWLAYAQGSSHTEIGDALGMKPTSIKVLLFRARRKLAGLLRGPDGERSAS